MCFPVNFQNVEKHIFLLNSLVAASSNFKASGFTETVMQMSF